MSAVEDPVLTPPVLPLHNPVCAVLILVGVGLEVAPSPGERPSCLGPRQTLPTPSTNQPPSRREGGLPGQPSLPGTPSPELSSLPTAGVSSAIFFVPGFLLLVPGGENDVRWGVGGEGPCPLTDGRLPSPPTPAVYHVIFICCAVKGHRGFQFFYLPYFEK